MVATTRLELNHFVRLMQVVSFAACGLVGSLCFGCPRVRPVEPPVVHRGVAVSLIVVARRHLSVAAPVVAVAEGHPVFPIHVVVVDFVIFGPE